MVLTHNTKRKRKEVASTSVLLDESPKRTKVQAQRKFAQGSNVSSPVLTPVEELDGPTDRKDVLPEPVDLEPMKRPNTEDFLTFLCFRGTPALPPNLSFFNNPRNDRTSIGSSSNSSSNGSIATIPFASIAQSSLPRRSLPLQPPPSICSIMRPSPSNAGFSGTDSIGAGGRPFVAFGVRKRADPVLVSRHMDRKRRHALAVHALRRRYQEQRQAKLRALTVSKLSADKGGGNLGGGGWGANSHRESKELSREVKETPKESLNKNAASSDVPASSTATTIRAKRKAANIRVNLRPVISKVRTRANCAPSRHKAPRRIIKRVEPPQVPPIPTTATDTLAATSTTKAVKQKMCLRSFRGRFVQRELTVVKVPQKQRQRRISAAKAVVKQQNQKMVKKTTVVKVKTSKEAVEEEKSDGDSDDEPLNRRRTTRKQGVSAKSSTKTTMELRLTRSSRLNIKPAFTTTSSTKRQTLQRRLITTNAKNIFKTKLRQRAEVSKETLTTPEVVSRKLGLRGAINREIVKQKTLPRRVVRRMVIQSEVIPVKAKKVAQELVDVKKVSTLQEVSKELTKNSTKDAGLLSLNADNTDTKKSLENVKTVVETTVKTKETNLIKEKLNVKSVTTRHESIKASKSNEKVVVVDEISPVITRNADRIDKDKVTAKLETKISKVEKVVQQLKESVIEKSGLAKTMLKEKIKLKENSEIIPIKEVKVVEKPLDKKVDNKDKCDILDLKPEKIVDNLKDKIVLTKIDNPVVVDKQDVNIKSGNNEKQIPIVTKPELKEKLIAAKVNLRKQLQPIFTKLPTEDSKVPKLNDAYKSKIIETAKITTAVPPAEKPNVLLQRTGTEIAKEIIVVERLVSEKVASVKETKNGDAVKDAAKDKQCLLKAKVAETVVQLPKNLELLKTTIKETSKILINKKVPKTTAEIKLLPPPLLNIPPTIENTKTQVLNKPDIKEIVVDSHPTITSSVKVEQPLETIKKTSSPKQEVEIKKSVKSEMNSSIDETISEVIANDSKLKAKIDFLESKLQQRIENNSIKELVLVETKKLKADEAIPEVQKPALISEITSPIQNVATASISISINDQSATKKNTTTKRNAIETVTNNSLSDNKKKKLVDETVKMPEIIKKPELSTPVSANNTIISFSKEVINNKSCKEDLIIKKILSKRRLVKDKNADVNVSQRPTRKTKEAAALYMEILNHKLENDDDNGSIDSFPELPNVKRMFQREHELKNAQATKNKPDKIDDQNSNTQVIIESDSSDDCLIKYKITKGSAKVLAKESTKAQVNIEKRTTRNKSPKLYKSFTDTDESDADNKIEIKPKQTTAKRKSDNTSVKKVKDATVVDFSESDEEPLANLMSTKEPSSAVTIEITAEVPSPTYGKPKRECTKRPQNYLTIFSSSDDEERYFLTKKPEVTINPVPKKDSTPVEVLTSKDIGRRFGKGKVNMSTEQIEKWLNDSALAGLGVRKENDELLKFGEKIPSATEVAKVVQTPITLAESLKSDIVTITGPLKDKPLVKSAATTTASNSKPSSAERKTIFRKKLESLTPVISPHKVNAFSVQNERSVYAFEPEPEVTVSTPFRRPTRRPSSTATSKSEDETKLIISEEVPTPAIKSQFRHPSSNVTSAKSKMHPPKVTNHKSISDKGHAKTDKSIASKINASKGSQKNSVDRTSETSEDWKYKVPSSPSAASSSSSAKLYKKSSGNATVLKVSHAEFPPVTAEKAAMVDSPVFYPTEKEFQDPLEYIEKIRSHAEHYGICKIVPPANFRPECKIADEMRFTAYNQYVGKMLRRWGPSFKELMAIRRYLRTQGISLKPPPLIGGVEVDLPRLYQTVQTLGGLKEVIEKKKWPKVSESMKIPKSAQDRVTKLDDIYCKYLLPYDTLSPAEREKLFDEVETNWAKRESKSLLKAQKAVMDDSDDGEDESDEDDEDEWEHDEAEECIVKGKNMALNAFFRIARNTLAMWFKNPEPLTTEVEDDFWRLVRQRQQHVCVHSGSIDCGGSGGPSGTLGSGGGYGFATGKSATCARHPANLKVLTNSSGSVLRSMGPIMGLTVPTLHVGMVFSACCWYRDPHRLPWVEYLHTGAAKVWYAVPGAQSPRFQAAVNTHMPQYCRNKSLWLPVDTAMLPPELLTKSGCSLSRVVQEPGQFVVVFEEAFTSNICTGYVVSESVFWAPSRWLSLSAQAVFHELRANREPSVFSYERLVLSIAADQRASIQTLKEVVEPVQAIHDRERAERGRLVNALGVKEDKDKLPLPDVRGRRRRGGRGGGKQGGAGQTEPPPPQHWAEEEEGEYECYVCRANLYVSMVADTRESVVFCLSHAIRRIEQSRLLAINCRLLYTYTVPELDALCSRLQALIDLKLQRKQPYKAGVLITNSGGGKFTGLPTLLNR